MPLLSGNSDCENNMYGNWWIWIENHFYIFFILIFGMKHSPKKTLDSVSNFIEKTYRILENDEFVSFIEWTPIGSSFIIKDIKQF